MCLYHSFEATLTTDRGLHWALLYQVRRPMAGILSPASRKKILDELGLGARKGLVVGKAGLDLHGRV